MALKGLSIILVIVLVMFTFYILIAEGVIDFSDPYPSEETPLSIQPWGLTWDRHIEFIPYDDQIAGLNYSSLTYYFTRYDEGGSIGIGGALDVGTFIDVETFVPPTTVEEAEAMSTALDSTYGDDGVPVHAFTCYFISDQTDSLRFNQGDSISLVHLIFKDGVLSSTGFEEGCTYEFELRFDDGDGGGIYEGYGFAVHDGELYSWFDHGPIDDPLS